MDDSPYLRYALELADSSREILRECFYDLYKKFKCVVEVKKDGTPVTQADLKTEEVLRSKIKKKFPEHGILGEEFGIEKELAEKGLEEKDYIWVIDPLDGTKSFLSGNPLFGTLIALLYKKEPILGVADFPILDQRFWGEKSKPSFIQNRLGLSPIQTRSCKKLSDAVVRTTSTDMFSQEEDKAVLARAQKASGLILYGGDCFCYAQLAAGFADIVIETRLQAHDFLALVPIIEGAKGKITDWAGQPLGLHTKKGDVLASGSLDIHQAVRRHIIQ